MRIHEKEKSLRRPELTLEDLLYVGIYRKGSKVQYIAIDTDLILFHDFMKIKTIRWKNRFWALKRELAEIEEPVLNHMCKHLRGDISKLRDMIEYKTKLL
jgi:hypothetical protein